MMKKKLLAAVVLTLTLFPFAASAAEGEGSSADRLAGLAPMDADALGKYAGGYEGGMSGQAVVNSTVTGNSIGDVGGTGEVHGNYLSGNSGMTTLIANSGNQVSISQSTVVNVYLH